MQHLIDIAKELGLSDPLVTSTDKIVFDRRARLKCLWGCSFHEPESPKCGVRGTSFEERRDMARAYKHVLVAGHAEARPLTLGLLELERRAFLEGLPFAFVIRACNYCKRCALEQGKACAFPEKVRPCDQAFGIDVYSTVRGLGLGIKVLTDRDQTPSRYGFLFLD